MSDYQVENLGLKNQVESMASQLDRLVNDNGKFEDDNEKMRNQLKSLQSEKLELTELLHQRPRP